MQAGRKLRSNIISSSLTFVQIMLKRMEGFLIYVAELLPLRMGVVSVLNRTDCSRNASATATATTTSFTATATTTATASAGSTTTSSFTTLEMVRLRLEGGAWNSVRKSQAASKSCFKLFILSQVSHRTMKIVTIFINTIIVVVRFSGQ